jgi:flagellar P-ring protein precursor FlgI
MKRIYLAAIILCCSIILAQGAVRIKDIARIESDIDRPLIGYGLVVGLEGTGDKGKAGYTTQAVRNMLSRMGLSLSEDQIKVRNVAAVMVTARLNTFAKKGAVIDAMVSSMGDASSLKGGILLQTPLTGPDGKLYALAQGPVSLEGVRTTNGDDRYLTAGRISGGAVLMVTPENA